MGGYCWRQKRPGAIVRRGGLEVSLGALGEHGRGVSFDSGDLDDDRSDIGPMAVVWDSLGLGIGPSSHCNKDQYWFKRSRSINFW